MTALAPLKIDLHTHILPERWPDLRERYGYGGWVRLEHFKPCCARMMIDDHAFREIQSNCWDPQQRLVECDRDHVGVQVLSTVPVMFSYWARPGDALDLAMRLNDHIADVCHAFPQRFAGLGTVPMQLPRLAIQELRRCITDLGLRGIEIGTNINGINLDEATFFPIFEAAADLGACVFVHPWEMIGQDRMAKYWLPWLVGMPAETALAVSSMIFGGVLERLPNLRVCFAHGGGAFPFTIGRIEHGFLSRPDLCAADNDVNPREYLGRFWVDSLVHDPNALRYLLSTMGEKRIVLGSDYPFPLGEEHPGQLIESMTDLSPELKRRLLIENALEFLGMTADAFGAKPQATPMPNSATGNNAHAATPVSARHTMTPAVTTISTTEQYQRDETFARQMDATDPLRQFRERFCIPRRKSGEPVIYFAGNSLGLQPQSVRALIEQELDDWARLGVDAHFDARNPWYPYHEQFRDVGARLVGARVGGGEVVMMNSLTINLHLMMVSFFRPTKTRFKILIEDPVFPSDLYAVKTHMRTRGLDPDDALLIINLRDGEFVVRTDDIESLLSREGESIALVMLAGVNFFTGQAMDIQRITAAGHRAGCVVGFDLAHAAGNLHMHLHDWNVDFAVWCSYKYLNSGPGAVAGCFVHERHGKNLDLPRYAGWWGNDPGTRFKMHLNPEFIPRDGADGWQLSNPPIFAMAPLKASLDVFDEATMPALRGKSLKLTGYLRFLLDEKSAMGGSWSVITPREAEAHGCQQSIMVHDHPRERFKALQAEGVVCDFREPNVIRVAPTPLYNTFHECWRFADILARQV